MFQSFSNQLNVDSQKQLEMQRLQAEQHLKRQQEQIMQHNIQELQAKLTKSSMGTPNPQSLMYFPLLEQLRAIPLALNPQMPPPSSTATTGNKHINSIANVISTFFF